MSCLLLTLWRKRVLVFSHSLYSSEQVCYESQFVAFTMLLSLEVMLCTFFAFALF